MVGLESSPGSGNDDDHGEHGDLGDHDKKRQPGVKRACNECRQQKVSLVLFFLPNCAVHFHGPGKTQARFLSFP